MFNFTPFIFNSCHARWPTGSQLSWSRSFWLQVEAWVNGTLHGSPRPMNTGMVKLTCAEVWTFDSTSCDEKLIVQGSKSHQITNLNQIWTKLDLPPESRAFAPLAPLAALAMAPVSLVRASRARGRGMAMLVLSTPFILGWTSSRRGLRRTSNAGRIVLNVE